jgi:hypothetical protein
MQDVTQDPPVGATTEDINDEITTHAAIVEAHQAEYLDADAVAACDGVVDAASVGGLTDGEFDAATLNGKAEGSLSVDDASKLGGTAASSYALDADLPTVPSSTGNYEATIGYFVVDSGAGDASGRSTSLDDGGIYVDAVTVYNDEGSAYSGPYDYTVTLNRDGSQVDSVSGSINLSQQEGDTTNLSSPVFVDEAVIDMTVDFSSVDWRYELHQIGVVSHSHSI